ncbi:unnamed protein product [Dovyalis caffra]|uniref:Uncharacterized protein n=1 Tax=Dovyalis caffra TaxID=77055 RepID=A0AAV1SD46_9ROSI|nr:unnamed protein product [Dovyalis caffra]
MAYRIRIQVCLIQGEAGNGKKLEYVIKPFNISGDTVEPASLKLYSPLSDQEEKEPSSNMKLQTSE